MGKLIIIFAIVLALLGFGVILFIENITDDHEITQELNSLSITNSNALRRKWYSFKIKANYWKHKIKRKFKEASKQDDSPQQLLDPSKIKKWQDKDGVWHFEDQTASTP